MQKLTAGRSLGRDVDAEVETLRLLAMQRRKASFSLFLKQSMSSNSGAEVDIAEKAKPQAVREQPAGHLRAGGAISRLDGP